MAKIISFVSGKGGVGKTVITAEVGGFLSALLLEKKVLSIDMDFGLRNLDIVHGVQNLIVYDITDVLDGTVEFSKAKVTDYCFGVDVLPASQTKTHADISPEKLQALLEKLRGEYDYILIDSPSGIGAGFVNSVSFADLAVVIMTADDCSLRDADKVLGELEKIEKSNVKLLVNRQIGSRRKAEKAAKKYAETLSVELLGNILEGKLTAGTTDIAKRIET